MTEPLPLDDAPAVMHGPREVAELLSLRDARRAGVSAVAYQLSARRKFRDADARERARYVASVI